MKTRNSTKSKLLSSVIALVLCVSMLIGATFAWFTDTASTGVNKIQAGNLDVELEYTTDFTNWATVQDKTDLFKNDTLWEPGHTEVAYLRIRNAGSLALNYNLLVYAAAEVGAINVNNEQFKLSQHLKFAVKALDAAPTAAMTREEARAATASPLTLGQSALNATKMEPNSEQYLALVVYMPETVGNVANAKSGTASIDLKIQVNATQATAESDSFNDQYDADANGSPDHPEFDVPIETVETQSGVLPSTVTEDGKKRVSNQTTVDAGGIKVTYDSGVKLAENKADNESVGAATTADAKQGLVYTGTESDHSNITISGNDTLAVYELTLPVAQDNTVLVKIQDNIGVNQVIDSIYHNGTALINGTPDNGASVTDDEGYYQYNRSTGDLDIWVLHASEIAVKFTSLFAGGTGTEADPYQIATAQQFANIYYAYDGNHFKLMNDIMVSSVYTVEWVKCATPYLANGTFDGNNHTITVSDGSYDVNLFYSIWDATIKNLNVVLDYSLTVYCDDTVTFDNVDVSGGFTVTGNEGAYVIYDFATTLNFIDCVADVEMNGTSYNAVFVGYVNWGQTDVGTLNFTRCENKGTLVCNYAAMFIGNPNAYNVVCNAYDCVNSGTIQATNTNVVFNYYYAVTSNCYSTFKINGTVYNDIADGRSSAPSCFEDTVVTTTGQAIQGPQNTGMALTQNADGTFSIRDATIDGATVDHYTVYVGVYAALKAGGSSRNYVTETISASDESRTTTLKNLKFVDADWVKAHTDAVLGKLAGNVTYTSYDETYYMLVSPETDTLNGKAKAPQMIYVVAYDASNKTLASAQLLGNIA